MNITIREYFIAIGKSIEGIPCPDNLDIEEIIHFGFDLYKKEIEPEKAAIMVLEQFGIAKKWTN